MCSARSDWPLRQPGFPIRRSSDRSLLGGSPRLIAACNVLHRLLAPRHPPYALCTLALDAHARYGVLKVLRASIGCGLLRAKKIAGDRLGHRQPPAARAVLVAALSRFSGESPHPVVAPWSGDERLGHGCVCYAAALKVSTDRAAPKAPLTWGKTSSLTR
jgi:hypothetical protein